MTLDGRPKRFHGSLVHGFDFEHRVRITHGHGADGERLAGNLEGIGIDCHRRIKGE
jgi:hypothetical protein